MSYKFLNLDGLERFFKKVKGIIPTKTSELQNDSGFITAQGTYDDELSDTSEKAVQNKVVKQALDLKADDSSVVHTTGNETVGGVKTFTSDTPLRLKTEDVEISTIPSATSDNAIRFTDKNNTIIADVKYSQYPSGNSEFGLNLRTKDTNNNTISKSVILNADQNGTWHNFRPSGDSEIGLGSANYKWKSVYADNYYKGTTAFGDIVTHDDSEYADASHTHTASDVSGLSTVATSGSYNDLSNKPTIPTVNNKTLTIKKNGTSLGTFTANSSTDETVDITVPTKTSDITNDSGFLTSHNPVDSALSGTSVNAVQNKVVKSALDGKSDTGHTHVSADITDLSIPSKVSDLTNDSGYITGVSWNDVSGKPSSFTPSSHSHGSITNDGKLGTAANKPLITGSNGVISTGSFGTSANTFCQGNDSRLSDARTPLSHTHGNSDITSLDASKITSGTIDIARLPKGALERLVTVADQTSRFALTSNDVQLGDTVKQLDTGVMYIVSDESKLSSADGYTEYTAGSATSVPWSGVTGKPSSYTPASHSHGNIANGGTLGTASRALITDGNKKITTSSVTSTELGYLSGVTSAIQTQISGKANASHTHSASDITSGLATVATSGSYNDLSNKPTIPTVNNATLTIQKNGTTVKTFTANASSNVTANITVPTKTSELTNDSGYLTSHQDISGLSAKADTIKSLSISGRTITYTKGDDTTGTLTTQDNNTWTAMVGATSSANGSVGYVNAVPPKDGYNTKYLRADGTWAVPPDHTYTVNNKTLTIQKNGTSVATFTANSASDVTANIVVPTKTSDLTNDSHQTITVSTDTTSTASPAHSGTFTCIDSVTRDSNGHVTKVNTKTITLPSDNNTDTKVTQTATNSNAYYPVLVANTNIANTGTLPTTSTEGVRKSYSLSVNTRYGFLYGRNPYDTDNLKGSVAGGNRTSAAMYSLTYDNAVVGAVELGRVDKYGNRYSRLYAANYITDGALATDGTAIASVLDIGVLSNGLQYISTSGGWYCNVYPCTTNERSLGTADLKWSNVYATTFTGNLTGNVTGNVTGNCSGSSGSCTGNAATATKATGNANGKELTNTIIKGLSVSGKTITYTQIDGTTGTITTQDTNTDTLMTQNVSTTNATYPILLCATANATANQGAKTGIFGSGVKVNPSTSTISATTFSGSLSGNAATSSGLLTNTGIVQNGITYTGGMYAIGNSAGQLYKGSSNNASLISAPENGTVWAETAGNVQNLRFTWANDGKYLHDIFVSPNNNYIWHRDVVNGTAKPWRRVVEENATGLTDQTWSINIGGSSGSCTGNAATASKVVATVANDDTGALVQGTMGGNDCFRIAIGGANNAGWAEIATGDDYNEPIYVRQYQGSFATLKRTATLLDASGNTAFPGTVTATGFSGPLTGNVTGNCSGSSGSCTGNAATATQFSANKSVTLTGDVTGTASSKAGWSVATTLANSGVTAGSYGPTADVTGNNNATISVPQITVDAKGRVTSVVNRTLTCKNNTYNVYNKTLTIQKNGTNVATFTSNSNTDVTANITVPTKTSELTNDSGFITSSSNITGSSGSCTGNSATSSGLLTNTGIVQNGITYTGGSYYIGTNAGQLYKGSSNNAALISAPENGTYWSSTVGNVQNLRFSWSSDGKYLHDIFVSPNNDYIWHRNVSNGTARGWRRVVEENVSGLTNQTWSINIGGSSASCTGNAATATTATTANESLKVSRQIDEGYVDILQTYQKDNNNYRSCTIRCTNGNGSNTILLGVHNESNGAPAGISITSTNGTLSATAPTPATSSNDTSIATTAFVKAQGYITSSSNITGTSANVTGTVAIANGGTGATTRLGAVQNLTNENVGTNSQYFITITTNWGKAGYCSVADAKTVLGLGSAAYTASTAYAAASHAHSDYLTKTTNVSEMGRYIDLHYDNATSKYDYDVRLYADSQGTAAGGGSFKIAAATAYAPAPASDANDTRIATTKWVKDRGFLTSHQSLANYVTLDGTQTISGAKTFSSNVTVNLGSSTDSGYNITANVSRKDVGDGKFYGTYINAGSSSGPGTLGVYGYIRNTDGTSELQMRLITSKSDGNYILKSLQFQADRYGNTWQFIPNANNTINLGTSSNKWKTAHAVNFYENGTALSSKYVQINSLAGGNAAGSLTHSIGSLVLACCAESALANTRSYANVSGNQLYPCRTEMCTSYDATGYHYVPIVVRYSSDSNLGSGTWRYLGGSGANVNSDAAKIYGMFLRVA